MRPEQARLALIQGGITITGAMFAYVVATPLAAKSLAYGGGVTVIGTIFLSWRYQVCARREALGAEWILRQAYRTAIERFMLVAFLLATGFKLLKLAPLWLLMGFAIGQAAWFAAPVWMKLRTQNDK